jgi:hypothetical protein
MDVAALLTEVYGRIPPLAERAVAGVPADRLAEPPGPGRNSIGWLVWHLARVQDSQVAAVRPPDGGVLLDYLAAVAERTAGYLAGLTADDLDRVVDRRWDPPVTLGVRLVSVADDCLQHAGQAAYVRGLIGA